MSSSMNEGTCDERQRTEIGVFHEEMKIMDVKGERPEAGAQVEVESWNLSNLCLSEPLADEDEAYHVVSRLPKRRTIPPQTCRRPSFWHLYPHALYPSRSEIPSVSFGGVEDIFDKLRSHSELPSKLEEKQEYSEEHTCTNLDTRVGAYQATAPLLHEENPKQSRPPPPTWIDTNSQGYKPSSSMSTHSRRHEIEIAPGEYMPLRGSVETMDAVNNGSATQVACLACGIELQCVPDADLVICPDCRVLSPTIPQDQQQEYCSVDHNRSDCLLDENPSYDQRKNASFGINNDKRHGRVRGVGLGCKIQF